MIIIFKLYTKQMNIFAVFLIIPEVKEPFLFLYLPIIIMQQNIMNEPSWEPEQDKDLNNEFMHSKPPQTHIQFQQIDNSLIKPQPSPIPPSDKFRKKKAQSKKHQRGVQDNPEYFRIDLEVAIKIYEIYRKLKILPPQQYNTLSFEEKEQGHNTINYHKIMQLFKDIDFRLQINHKLQILRAIKKFCFNQNFINEDEFIKIFKVIVHGLGIKQTIFKGIITAKYASVLQRQSKSNHKKAISIKLNKNFGKKLKTQSQMQSSKVRSPFTQMIHQQKSYQTILNPLNADMSYLKKIPTIPPSIVIQESMVKSSRKHESRQRILTQASRYEPNQKLGYLNRAIQKSKLGKLTWQNLFNMTEQNMHHNISIPSFVSQDININDLDI